MQAMIFAAGLGTRLKPITDRIPKALLPIGGKTLLEWQLDMLRAAGITDVVINVHHLADQIIDFVKEHDGLGMHIRFSDEREMLLETGGGLLKAWREGLLSREEPVLVCNVDILSNICIGAIPVPQTSLGTLVVSERTTQRYLLFAKERAAGTNNMAEPDGAHTPFVDESCSNCALTVDESCTTGDNLLLRGWTNRATGEYRPASLAEQSEALVPLAFSGMQVLSPAILPMMEEVAAEKGDKFSLVDLYIHIASHDKGRLLAHVPAAYRMMDIGKIDHLQEAERFAESL